MQSKHRDSGGRALLNSLVVVGILGVLAALIPPAISRARESMRQSQCRRNLEQCGLALSTYHEVHRLYPPGIVAASVPTGGYQADCDFVATTAACDWPGSSLTSGLALMLPYLGERDVHKEYNFAVACCSSANATAISRRNAVFACPTNHRPDRQSVNSYYMAPTAAGSAPAGTDYVLNLGASGALQCRDLYSGGVFQHGIAGQMRRSSGVFAVNSSMYIDAIKDGVSNTFLMGESTCSPDVPLGTTDSNGAVVNGAEVMKFAGDIAFDNPWCQGYLGGRPSAGGRNYGGYGSVFGATAWNAWYDTNRRLANRAEMAVYPPNEGGSRFARPTWYRQSIITADYRIQNGEAHPGSLGSIQGFRSRHAGKVHMLFADGSVRAFADSVDPFVWIAMSTAVGREWLETDPQ